MMEFTTKNAIAQLRVGGRSDPTKVKFLINQAWGKDVNSEEVEDELIALRYEEEQDKVALISEGYFPGY